MSAQRFDAVVRVRFTRLPEIITEVMVTSGWVRLPIEKDIEQAYEIERFITVHDFLRSLYPSVRDFIITTEMRTTP